MIRHCLLCGRARHDNFDGDHCRPCRLALKFEAALLIEFRRLARRRLTRAA